MNIEIICIGNLKEKHWRDAEAEYKKRLSNYCGIKITELKEARLPANASPADEASLIEAESQSLMKAALKCTGKQRYTMALDRCGKSFSSEGFAAHMKSLALSGDSDVCIMIGGSLGLSRKMLDASDMAVSFSEMTFPHQLMRIILLEQLYRAYRINRNEPYHK